MIVTVAPNTWPPLHVHHIQEEVFHIIKGRFKFQAGDETTICDKGDFAYVPAGTPHAFINLSDEPGEFIAVFTPGGTDKFFKEFGPMMNSDGGPPDEEKVVALLEKHGMSLLGPPLSQEHRMEIPQDTYQAIENEIASDDSPVGIDAKKTHIMILHQLREIDERLKRIEDGLGAM